MITGKNLVDMGFKSGSWFKECLQYLNVNSITNPEQIKVVADKMKPKYLPLRADGVSYTLHIDGETPEELENINKVVEHMKELMRVPTVEYGSVMPDACPSDKRLGYIPVGGVVATKEAIHPGMHSADICCSVAATYFPPDTDPTSIVDAGMFHSHFGGGGRERGKQYNPSESLLNQFEDNPYLKYYTNIAIEHFATQGDGNHFFYVGRLESTGNIVLVTHHGSRKPGAMLYKTGMSIAEKICKKISPETPSYNAWIPSESTEGHYYWEALQIIREWTKQNHFKIHDLVVDQLNLKIEHRFWNEHNFVFRKSDGLFYHAKGATPVWENHANDSTGQMLIPLNMAQPILVVEPHKENTGLQFAPHGAGRNFSRTAYIRKNSDIDVQKLIELQTPGIDVRYFCGIPDISELPEAYKNADSIIKQIEKYKLANIVDKIYPLANIMAGDWQANAPWRRR
jgi:tRNA-splicing ligase RtcB (3'-phosphate/5'-hydroxy nucleic acid ligase)